MDRLSEQDVTRMLRLASAGEANAAADVLPLVYGELRALAEARLRSKPPAESLQSTALVHEAYLRLVGQEDPGWEGRSHFFFAAARAMRDILVERARSRASWKRGGGRRRVNLDQLSLALDSDPDDLIALHEALERLQLRSERHSQLVMFRFFAGMTLPQTAELMGLDERTLRRDWTYVRALLHRELSDEHLADDAGMP